MSATVAALEAMSGRRATNVYKLRGRGDSPSRGHCGNCNLREVCLPCSLNGPDTDLLEDLGYTRKRVKRGESLFRAGSGFDSLFAVRSGFFKSSVVLEDGRDQVTGFHMAGEILGMDGIGTESHTSDVIALEDSEDCIIPYARLEEPAAPGALGKA